MRSYRFCNGEAAVSLDLQLVDLPHDFRCGFIDDQMTLVSRVAHVTERCVIGNVHSLLPLDRKRRSHFAGSVAAVLLIHQIFEWDEQAVRLPTLLAAVISIVYGDESNTKLREDLFDVIAGLQIFTSETGKILYDDAVHAMRINRYHQALEA